MFYVSRFKFQEVSAEVKILVEGYTNADSIAENGEEKSCSTVTLVKDGDLTMVVDPGALENQQILIDALSKHGLSVSDVDVVCITHSHIDHYRNVGMFPNAKALEYFGLWDKNTVRDWFKQFSPNIQILRTPGHDYTGITLFVTTKEGIVAVCGDVFWKESYPPDPHDDRFASEPDKLRQSRELVIGIADWVIPGHGKMYEIKRTGAAEAEEAASVSRSGARVILICKKCRRPVSQEEKCLCRPWLCYRCCECGLDCDLCSCSHKK